MVSLEERLTYYDRIKESPKLIAFYNLLFGNIITPLSNYSNEAEKIFYGIIISIQENNKNLFDSNYSKKSKSNPNKNYPPPFVNDDFLIFCLVLGVLKFNYDISWIKSIIKIRQRNPITITLENILNENYFSKSNLPELVLMFLHLTNQNLITNDFLDNTYNCIVEKTNLFDSKNDIQIICAIKSFDLILLYNEPKNADEIELFHKFEIKFIKRIRIFAWILQTIIFILLLVGVIKLININPQIKSFFDSISSALKILGILGLSQIINISSAFRKLINRLVLRLFGYPKELIKNEE